MADEEQLSLVAEIDALSTRNPFVPYAIVMMSGNRYPVRESDAVSVGKTMVAVVPAEGGQYLLPHFQISELVVEEPPP